MQTKGIKLIRRIHEILCQKSSFHPCPTIYSAPQNTDDVQNNQNRIVLCNFPAKVIFLKNKQASIKLYFFKEARM